MGWRRWLGEGGGEGGREEGGMEGGSRSVDLDWSIMEHHTGCDFRRASLRLHFNLYEVSFRGASLRRRNDSDQDSSSKWSLWVLVKTSDGCHFLTSCCWSLLSPPELSFHMVRAIRAPQWPGERASPEDCAALSTRVSP